MGKRLWHHTRILLSISSFCVSLLYSAQGQESPTSQLKRPPPDAARAPKSPGPLGEGGTTGFPTLFEDVTDKAGIRHVGPSFGASWSDFNGDGWPDLYVGNHFEAAGLYRNNRDGSFSNVAAAIFQQDTTADSHGGAFADVDNDGDQDLLVSVGANSGASSAPNQLWIQDAGTLTESAAAWGIDYPLGRGRHVLWLDWNRDGRLDVLLSNYRRSDGQAPTALFLQTTAGFTPVPNFALQSPVNSTHAQLSDLNEDGQIDLAVHGSPYPNHVLVLGDPSGADRAASVGLLPKIGRVRDTVFADLDGDSRSDLYLATSVHESGFIRQYPYCLEVRLVAGGLEAGVDFTSLGPLIMSFGPPFQVNARDIFIGSSGLQPPRTTFVLVPHLPAFHGLPPYSPGVDEGIYIGLDLASGQWQVRNSSPRFRGIDGQIEAAVPVTQPRAVGFDPHADSPPDRLLLGQSGGLIDAPPTALPTPTSSSEAVVAGDFDNDMDLDLYLVRTGPVANQPNTLLENLGGARFRPVPRAGGASGTRSGRGDSVTTVDYDHDGFLDLFLTQGADSVTFATDGPYQLFRNRGNDNHWLEIDLVGRVSNRDAIGARVIAEAQGVRQLREHSGGIHKASQNSPRLHFGLGSNAWVDLTIHWPRGTIQHLAKVQANQILRVVEPESKRSRQLR